VLRWILSNLGHALRNKYPIKKMWESLIKDAIAAGVNLHFAAWYWRDKDDQSPLTPFLTFIASLVIFEYHSCLVPWPKWSELIALRRQIDICLQGLFNVLSTCGVDLASFCEVENQNLRCATRAPERSWPFGFEKDMTTWVEDALCVTWGPSSTHWHFEYRSHPYDHAGGFWRALDLPMSIYDLMTCIIEAQAQYQTSRETRKHSMPGMWTEPGLQNEYEFCQEVDYLAELSLEEYTDLVDQVRHVDVRGSDDGAGAWWLSSRMVSCRKSRAWGAGGMQWGCGCHLFTSIA
jgi:hypothetical protein